ncbi:MAG: hypothetical protein NTU98_03245 [Bacteroidetes bacterium]|nr:hypothetical protein [Bacteroidota bacterium]
MSNWHSQAKNTGRTHDEGSTKDRRRVDEEKVDVKLTGLGDWGF